MTACDEPYIGDESISRPPAAKKARITSVQASRAAGSLPTLKVIQLPRPTRGRISPLDGIALPAGAGAAALVCAVAIGGASSGNAAKACSSRRRVDSGRRVAGMGPLLGVPRGWTEIEPRLTESIVPAKMRAMSPSSPLRAALTGAAFATLLLIAFMMGANHVAARVAFNHGVDVATAVSFRSLITAAVVGLILIVQRVPLRLTRRHWRALPLIGLLVGVQSLCLYAAVARLPVALALLAFNTYPLCAALWAGLLYRHRPEARVLRAMPVMLIGLALALDVFGAASGLGAAAQWGRIGSGVAFALAAAATFGLALVLTQHEAGDLDGRVRTVSTMALAGLIALLAVAMQGGFHLPQALPGWFGLAALTLLYGTAFTIMFTVLPRLGVVGNSAIMNIEPIFALVLAWAILGQVIAPMQVAGGLLVVATVIWLGLLRR